MGFPRQEYWSGLPFPSPGDLPDPGIEPRSPAGSLLHCRQILYQLSHHIYICFFFWSVLYYGRFETSTEAGRIVLYNSTRTPASKIVSFLLFLIHLSPFTFFSFSFFAGVLFFFLKQIPDIISFHCKYFSPYH